MKRQIVSKVFAGLLLACLVAIGPAIPAAAESMMDKGAMKTDGKMEGSDAMKPQGEMMRPEKGMMKEAGEMEKEKMTSPGGVRMKKTETMPEEPMKSSGGMMKKEKM